MRRKPHKAYLFSEQKVMQYKVTVEQLLKKKAGKQISANLMFTYNTL